MNVLRTTLIRGLFLAILSGVVWYAYAPSLDHMPRSDQWCWLIDMIDHNEFGDLAANTYSYSRQRKMGAGDSDLYRPILFLLLAAEKAWYANHFEYWQATGIVLHILVAALAFFLMLRLSRLAPNPTWLTRCLPYALTLFFACNFVHLELVTWHHLHGYLLFLIFLLGSLYFLMGVVLEGDRRWTTIAMSLILALLSAFTYELGQVYGLLAAIAVGCTTTMPRRQRILCGLAFLCVPIIYQAANKIDQRIHVGKYTLDNHLGEILDKTPTMMTLDHSWRFVAYTVLQPFYPNRCWWIFAGGRLQINEPGFDAFWTTQYKGIVSSIVVLSFAALLAIAVFQRQWVRQWRWLILPTGLWIAYSAMQILGRMNLRPEGNILSNNSYYTYTAFLFFLLTAFTITVSRFVRRPRFEWGAGILLLVGMVLLSDWSADRLNRANGKMARYYTDFTAQVRAINEAVDCHKHEPDFSISFALEKPDSVMLFHSLPYPIIFYKRWMDFDRPKYVIYLNGEKGSDSVKVYARADHPELELVPKLVHTDGEYNFFEKDATIFGIHTGDGILERDRELNDYTLPIVAPTLTEAVEQLPDIMKEHRRRRQLKLSAN